MHTRDHHHLPPIALVIAAILAGCGSSDHPHLDPGDAGVVSDGSAPEPDATTPDLDAGPTIIVPGDCTSPAGAAPSLTIDVPASIALERPMEIDWAVRGLPPAASIGFFLVRDSAADRGLPGSTGALTLDAQNVCPATDGTTHWNGQTVGCAPTDRPTFCDHIQPGRYRIEGVVYDREDVDLVTGLPRPDYVPPGVVVRASSEPFEIIGEYDLSGVRMSVLGAAARRVIDFLGAYSFAGTNIERYVAMRGDLTGPDASGRYCATFDVQRPAAGELTACGTLRYGEESVTGEVRLADGALSWADAAAEAQAAAERGYRPGLNLGVRNWVYRADGDYWLFVIYVIEPGGPLADAVLVRLQDDRSSCVIETVPYSGGELSVDIFTSPVSCP